MPHDMRQQMISEMTMAIVAKTWNNLPIKVVEAETVDTFKARLDEEWTNNPSKRSIDSLSTTNEDQEQFVEDLL